MSNLRMRLQHKVSATLAALLAAFVLVSWLILDSVTSPAFDDLELAAADADLKRARGAIATDLEQLQALTADWAPWDDMHDYVLDKNPEFEKSSLTLSSLDNLNIDLMAVLSTDGDLAWGKALLNGEEVAMDRFAFLDPSRPESEKLVRHTQTTDSTVGLVDTELGGMLVSSLPIIRTDHSGPVAGAIIMGQFMNYARQQRIQERTEVSVSWYTDGEIPHSASGVSRHVSEDSITLQSYLDDVHGKPYLLLQTKTPRSVTALGSQTITAAMLFLVTAGVLVSGFIYFMLRFTILNPIKELKVHIDTIRESGDLSHQIKSDKRDEIGDLARQFNEMTADLGDARHALLDQSFKSGKADTAAEVLHNIRNAMTPMINGLDRLKKAFHVTDNLRVLDATKAITDPDCPEPKRRKFIEYINASFEYLTRTGADASDDLRLVTEQAKQVEGIIAEQEKFAKAAPASEVLPLDDLLGEATNVIPRETSRAVDVTVEEDIRDVRVRAHRIGLLQVLGNLVLNAYESIVRSGVHRGEISLGASDELVDDVAMVRVTVRDNGTGFDGETARRIFMRGYTSKAEGDETGLGLHWCANAVAGMGGRIVAESDGHGRGAEFHVLLPAASGA